MATIRKTHLAALVNLPSGPVLLPLCPNASLGGTMTDAVDAVTCQSCLNRVPMLWARTEADRNALHAEARDFATRASR